MRGSLVKQEPRRMTELSVLSDQVLAEWIALDCEDVPWQMARELQQARAALKALAKAASAYRVAVRSSDVREMPLVDSELRGALQKARVCLPAEEGS